MSTLNLEHNATKKTNLIGHSYSGKQQLLVKPSLCEQVSAVFFNPITGSPGSVHRVDYNLSVDDEFNINEAYLEFVINNLDAVITQNIINPWLLFDSIKLLMNNQEVVFYDNSEAIFCASSFHYRQFSQQGLKSEIQKLFPTNYSVSAGETHAVSSANLWSLPLTHLFPFLKDLSRSQGLTKLSVEFTWKPNTNTAASVGRFIKSSTVNNCYTATTISFTAIQLRLKTTKHSDASLRAIQNPIMMINNFEIRMYNESFNSNTASKRIQLSTEYSHHNMVHGVLFYSYNNQAVSAFNDADCCKIDSQTNQIGFEIKYKSRSIVDYDAVNQTGQRNAYHIDVQERRGYALNHALIDTSVSSEGLYWVPLTLIDFQSVGINNLKTEGAFSGLSNANSEIELIFTNAVSGGTYATSPYLYSVLCYYQIVSLDAKTGIISKKN